MQFRHRGFVILLKDDHGTARALVVDPVNPRRFRSMRGRDGTEAAELARAYVDGLCDSEVERCGYLGQGKENAREMILVVDDHPATRRALVRLLNVSGWAAEGAADGQQALRATRDLNPRLVILDWMMPGMDGAGVLRAMRTEDELARVPVIVYSAIGGEETRRRALELGARACLQKSAPIIELFAAIEEHVPADQTSAGDPARPEAP